jgi:altronate dehydratase
LTNDENLTANPDHLSPKSEKSETDHFFGNGYSRSHQGKLVGAGIRNQVLVINTVKCSETATKNIAHLIRKQFLDQFENVDDVVVACTQDFGCGMPTGSAKQELIKLLVRTMNHSNIGAIVLIGLGCEHLSVNDTLPGNIISILREEVYDFDKRVFLDSIQNYASELDAVKDIA